MMHHTRHNLGKAEVRHHTQMLPGYAAIRFAPARRRSVKAPVLVIAALVLLALIALAAGVFKTGF